MVDIWELLRTLSGSGPLGRLPTVPSPFLMPTPGPWWELPGVSDTDPLGVKRRREEAARRAPSDVDPLGARARRDRAFEEYMAEIEAASGRGPAKDPLIGFSDVDPTGERERRLALPQWSDVDPTGERERRRADLLRGGGMKLPPGMRTAALGRPPWEGGGAGETEEQFEARLREAWRQGYAIPDELREAYGLPESRRYAPPPGESWDVSRVGYAGPSELGGMVSETPTEGLGSRPGEDPDAWLARLEPEALLALRDFIRDYPSARDFLGRLYQAGQQATGLRPGLIEEAIRNALDDAARVRAGEALVKRAGGGRERLPEGERPSQERLTGDLAAFYRRNPDIRARMEREGIENLPPRWPEGYDPRLARRLPQPGQGPGMERQPRELAPEVVARRRRRGLEQRPPAEAGREVASQLQEYQRPRGWLPPSLPMELYGSRVIGEGEEERVLPGNEALWEDPQNWQWVLRELNHIQKMRRPGGRIFNLEEQYESPTRGLPPEDIGWLRDALQTERRAFDLLSRGLAEHGLFLEQRPDGMYRITSQPGEEAVTGAEIGERALAIRAGLVSPDIAEEARADIYYRGEPTREQAREWARTQPGPVTTRRATPADLMQSEVDLLNRLETLRRQRALSEAEMEKGREARARAEKLGERAGLRLAYSRSGNFVIRQGEQPPPGLAGDWQVAGEVRGSPVAVYARTDEGGIIRDAAPIARRFIGQPIANLERWLGTRAHRLPPASPPPGRPRPR